MLGIIGSRTRALKMQVLRNRYAEQIIDAIDSSRALREMDQVEAVARVMAEVPPPGGLPMPTVDQMVWEIDAARRVNVWLVEGIGD